MAGNEIELKLYEGANTALYEKLYAELQQYMEYIKSLPPDELLRCSYELSIREDILFSLEENNLTFKQCKALLREEKPMDTLFKAWEKHEGKHMEEVLQVIEDKADDLAKQFKAKCDRER